MTRGLLTLANCRAAMLAAVGMFALAQPAQSAIVFSGTTIGGSTWDRPQVQNSFPAEVPVGTAGFANGFTYHATFFVVDATGSYAFVGTSTGPTWDTFAILYQNGFSAAPGNEDNNAVIADDDLTATAYTNAGPGQSGFSATLTAGVGYAFVMTGFQLSGNPNSEGAYNLDIAGPGNVTILAAIPEPASLALLLTGAAGLAAARRRRGK